MSVFFDSGSGIPAKMMLILFLKLLLVFSLLLVLLDEPPALLELFFYLLFNLFVAGKQLKHLLFVILGLLDDRQEKDHAQEES